MGKGTQGNLSKVVLLGATIGGISEHTIKKSSKDMDDSEYGITYEKFLPGIKTGEGSFKGKMREGDAGQAAIEQAFEAQLLISDIKFYYGLNVYYTPDITTDPDAGVLIKDLSWGSKMDGVVSLDVSFKLSGPLKKVSV